MKLTRLLLFVALFPLGLVACAGNQRPAHDVPITADDLTTTHVLNRNPYPVTVYLTRADLRHRLGVVESMSAGLFLVPSNVMDGRREFRLVAAGMGPHPTLVSETFMLQPGQTADWRLSEGSTLRTGGISLVSVR